MALFTESSVRACIRVRDGRRVFYLGPDDRLTPSARAWLQRENVEIVHGEQKPPKVYETLFGGTLTEKPEHMTHLHGNVLVFKDHPRIAFRGMIDLLEAEILLAQRTAHSIYQDIARAEPVFVFDLHEARYNEESRDFLGSSLIFTSLDGMDQLCMELLLATESGELCSERYNFFGPGPEGSVNHTVTTGLGIPTITIETYRGYPLERRIGDQLAIVEYVLGYYGLL